LTSVPLEVIVHSIACCFVIICLIFVCCPACYWLLALGIAIG
jgi:hypothetical protein